MSTNTSQSAAHPTLIDIPQPPSNPDTPSEMPGTPTSTTTSLSALSTTAIKDGHRGHALPAGPFHRGHNSNPSTNSLEAERADRISRLAGLSSVSRPGNAQAGSAQTTPTSSGFLPPHANAAGGAYVTVAYFDANGQPVAATKMSTVGTASASAATTTAQDGDGDEEMGGADDDDARTEADEDLLSVDANYEGSASASGYRDTDPMEEEGRSVGGFDDRMSDDDGSASLVGFGEGAGSTVSGPIYHRRPIPGGLGSSSAGAMDRHLWGLDRRDSGLSTDGVGGAGRRETVTGRPLGTGLAALGGAETPVGAGAEGGHRAALGFDGVAAEGPGVGMAGADDGFVDTGARGPVPVTSAIRETQQPGSYQQQPSAQYPGSTSTEAAERIVRERFGGQKDVVMESPKGEDLGKFYFEEKK